MKKQNPDFNVKINYKARAESERRYAVSKRLASVINTAVNTTYR